MKTKRMFIHASLICFSLTLFSLLLHISPVNNTMINYKNESKPNAKCVYITDGFLSWSVNYHKTLSDFKKRPLTSLLIEKVSSTFNIKISYAFVLVNFTLTFACGLLIYYLSHLFFHSHQIAIISAIIYLCSFSVLFAYFIPIATYDEPIQYFFLFLALIALKKNHSILFVGSLTMAIIARESSIFLIPGFIILMFRLNPKDHSNKKRIFLKAIMLNAIPLILYFIYLSLFYRINPESNELSTTYLSQRFSLIEKNFRNMPNITRTILSFASVYFLPLFLLIYFQKKFKTSIFYADWIKAFWITFFINTFVVLIAVFAEEARVFALPLIFLFPFLGQIISLLFPVKPSFFGSKTVFMAVSLSVIISFLFWMLIKRIYNVTDLNLHNNLYEEYHTICFFFMLLILSFNYFKVKNEV